DRDGADQPRKRGGLQRLPESVPCALPQDVPVLLLLRREDALPQKEHEGRADQYEARGARDPALCRGRCHTYAGDPGAAGRGGYGGGSAGQYRITGRTEASGWKNTR